jgi:hypothetical protein
VHTDQYIITKSQYYTVDSATGALSSQTLLPAGLRLSAQSLVTEAGQGTSNLNFSAVDVDAGVLYRWTPTTPITVTPLDLSSVLGYSLAAANGTTTLTLSADNQIYTVASDGTITPVIDPALLSSTADYLSYGKNGLLYVLDYGNDRVVMLDPANAFDQVGAFTLQSGVTTANEQFAIGANGDIYLGDGLGGGSSYTAIGDFIDTFDLPEGTVDDPYKGQSYLSTDSSGGVFVYDKATGFHEYQDESVIAVPEPGT